MLADLLESDVYYYVGKAHGLSNACGYIFVWTLEDDRRFEILFSSRSILISTDDISNPPGKLYRFDSKGTAVEQLFSALLKEGTTEKAVS